MAVEQAAVLVMGAAERHIFEEIEDKLATAMERRYRAERWALHEVLDSLRRHLSMEGYDAEFRSLPLEERLQDLIRTLRSGSEIETEIYALDFNLDGEQARERFMRKTAVSKYCLDVADLLESAITRNDKAAFRRRVAYTAPSLPRLWAIRAC